MRPWLGSHAGAPPGPGGPRGRCKSRKLAPIGGQKPTPLQEGDLMRRLLFCLACVALAQPALAQETQNKGPTTATEKTQDRVPSTSNTLTETPQDKALVTPSETPADKGAAAPSQKPD